MTLEDLRRHYGSIPNAAKALGLVRQAVYQWKEGIPRLRQYEIERMTGGALQAEPADGESREPEARA